MFCTLNAGYIVTFFSFYSCPTIELGPAQLRTHAYRSLLSAPAVSRSPAAATHCRLHARDRHHSSPPTAVHSRLLCPVLMSTPRRHSRIQAAAPSPGRPPVRRAPSVSLPVLQPLLRHRSSIRTPQRLVLWRTANSV
jgi:hypothetical protein